MPPNRGMNASNREVHAQHHRCKGSVESTFYKLPKKWGCSLSTPAFDASPPFTEKEHPEDDARGGDTTSPSRLNDYLGHWTHKKGGFPSPSQEDAFTPPERVDGTFTTLECCRHP